MIRKLRTRLIMISMLSLVTVLTVIMGGVNIMNYRGIVRDADSVLALLSDNDGRFPDRPADGDWRETGPRFKSPELKFELRFFSALMNSAGEVQSTDVSKIAAVDEETVRDYAAQAYAQGEGNGFTGDYRFMLYEDEGGYRVIFVDCGRMLAGFRAVLISSTIISLMGILAVFLLMTILSGRMIRPISMTYEKQKRFITDAGHEIKTPVTIIDADAELLEMEFGKSEWLEDIRAQTRRLTALTNDLIYLSRMEEAGKMPMIEFPISDLISEAAASFQALALTKNKHFSYSIQSMLSYCGNENSIRQLTGILLDNALKYSSGAGNIHLQLEQRGRSIVLTVSNDADGLTEDMIGNIFDRFYRADPSRNSSIQGYGIGLSIARAIVSAHKGKISAEISGGRFRVGVLLQG